jgi:trans-aconitate 2-methyltransferase
MPTSDWDGAGYAQVSGLQRAMAAASLESVVVAGTERVLDVGCGDGQVTRLLAARLPAGSVLGVDPSPRMIAAAAAGRNVTFQVGDVTTMSFAREFDLVVSFNALHWVADQSTAYRNIAAALRPDGRAVVQYVCRGPRPSIEQVAMGVTRDPRWAAAFADFAPPFVHIDPGDLAAISRMRLTDRSVVDREWDFGSREEFAKWCTVGFAAWTSRLSDGDVGAFVDDVVERYEGVVGRPGVFRFLQLRAELAL